MAVLAMGCLLFAVHIRFDLFAATLSDLRNQQNQKEDQLEDLNAQINSYEKEINEARKKSNTLQNQIAIFTAQINQATAQIAATQTSIDIATNQIAILNKDITAKEVKVGESRGQLGAMLRQMYEMDVASSTIMTLMNNDNLSDFISAVEQIESLQGKSYDLLQEIKQLKAQLEADKAEVEKHRSDLLTYQKDLKDQEEILNKQVAEKNKTLAETQGQEAKYNQLLAQSQAVEDKIQAEINNLENQIRAQQGNPSSPGGKGLFAWPMNNSVITQRYGRTGFTSLGYTFHNGYDIASPAGTPICAVREGTVEATGSGSEGYGNWVAIRHSLPNGRQIITLYGHMLRVSVQTGQKVGRCQIIGTEGNTGNTTAKIYGSTRGFHLHLTVFDANGFKIVNGSYGGYKLPTGVTYDPADFF
jgi:murein DD-endopeptidase MepM/ murein hydrolase activator NlpD